MKKKHTGGSRDAPASPTKKSRMKEAKETRLLFETIAKKLLIECTSSSNQKLETFCTDLINKKFAELRQDVVIMDSTLSARIAQVEHKVNDIGTKVADLTTDLVRQNTLLREDLTKVSQHLAEGLEGERQKRLASVKKIQSVAEGQAEQCKALVTGSSKEALAAVSSLNEDFRVQSREISRLKESVDDVLLKRYGFVPGTTHKLKGEDLAATFNQGLDAGVILDNLAMRIKNLEVHLGEEEFEPDQGRMGLDSSFQRTHNGHSRNGSSSPLRSLAGGHTLGGNGNVSRALTGQKIRRLEESVYDLRAQLQGCESEISEVKSTVLSKLRGGFNGGSPQRGFGAFGHHHNNQFEDGYQDANFAAGGGNNAAAQTAQEMKALQKKMKKLAENTTRACRSLSTSVSDVQQATLNLYSWTDTAHDAFGKVSHELGLKGNICPRARVYQPTSRAAPVGDLFQD